MNNKRLLVLGGGIDQIPGVLKAKEMGIYTIVLDGNPLAEAKKYADEFHIVSIKHLNQIENFLKNYKKKIDGVIAFGVDIPYIIAKTADILGVNYTISSESAKLSENKFEAKKLMQSLNIPIPDYKLVNNIEDIYKFVDKHNFPVILKPIDNSASRGISYIDSFENIEKYFEYALKFSIQKKVQVEKYLVGYQISTESFVINGKVYNIGFLDRNYNDMDRFLPYIIENGGDMPSIYMKEKHKKQLQNYLEIIAKSLNIQNGIIKGDIVIHNDKVYIIEFALRLSGGNFSTICIPFSMGVDFIKIAILLHLGMKIDEEELIIKNKNNVSMRYKFTEDVSINSLQDIKFPKDKNIILSKFHIQKGDKLPQKTTNHAQRLGFVIANGNNREEAIKNAQNYLNRVELF